MQRFDLRLNNYTNQEFQTLADVLNRLFVILFFSTIFNKELFHVREVQRALSFTLN